MTLQLEKYPLLFTPNVDDVVKLHEKRYAALAEVLKKATISCPMVSL